MTDQPNPATIGLGYFLPGGQLLPSGMKGINETYRGWIEVDEVRVQAYVKLVHPREVFNEALGSILCQLVGLPTPPAYLVLVERTDYPDSSIFAQLDETRALAFGSQALQKQTLSRHASFSSAIAIRELISKWSEWPDVLVFDQWIANSDRHPGNLLIGSPGEVHLIDHGRSFYGNNWTPDQLKEATSIQSLRLWNDFLEGIVTLPERVEGSQRANSAAAKLSGVDTSDAIDRTNVKQLLSSEQLNALIDFLGKRRTHAGAVICNAMGIHSLPFWGPQ